MKTALVITTINKANSNIKKFSRGSKLSNWEFIVIGDKKTPKNFKIYYGSFFDLRNQKKLNFHYSKLCPINSYTRKNIGYLIALKKKCDVIIETDDDNYPKKNFFIKRKLSCKTEEIKNKSWINIYDLFLSKSKNIWPRGLPLDSIKLKKVLINKYKRYNNFYIQQGIVNNNPDVDAIYRLINEKINIKFKNNYKVSLGSSLSPINSQNTTWFKNVFPLLYLPATCNMRCTDILRGYVALNILKKNNKKILFKGTDIIQNRNIHNLFHDYEQELLLYHNSKKIFKKLEKLNLAKGEKNYCNNLLVSYKLLSKFNIVKKNEIKFLYSWIKDINNLL